MSKVIRFIGDVHGKFSRYKKILEESPPGTVQIGDMGVGFRHSSGPREGEFSANPPHYAMLLSHARFIRGNHDNPAVCKQHSQYITDGHVEDGMMFVGGATSIDRAMRIEGYSWWEDEQLSYEEFEIITKVYEAEKPRVMVTHECPQSIAVELFGLHYKGQLEPGGTRTRQAFDRLLQLNRPKTWIFGHWHESRDIEIQGTRFICLAELEYKDIDIAGLA